MAIESFFFNSRDELLRVDISRAVYFAGEGNYTSIHMANGLQGTIGMNLGQTGRLLAAGLGARARRFARIGKRYIVNLDFVYQISVPRQRLVLSDFRTFTYTLDISKDALRLLKDLYVKKGLLPATGEDAAPAQPQP